MAGSVRLRPKQLGSLGEGVNGLRVCDYWKNGVGWDWSELQQHLSMSDLVGIESISLNSDRHYWDEGDGCLRSHRASMLS